MYAHINTYIYVAVSCLGIEEIASLEPQAESNPNWMELASRPCIHVYVDADVDVDVYVYASFLVYAHVHVSMHGYVYLHV